MPYDDNSFDIALSIFVTCELPIEVLSPHFKELHRVLVPGGKALVVNLSNRVYENLYVSDEANQAVVQKKINQILPSILGRPSPQQVIKAFEDLHEVYSVFCI